MSVNLILGQNFMAKKSVSGSGVTNIGQVKLRQSDSLYFSLTLEEVGQSAISFSKKNGKETKKRMFKKRWHWTLRGQVLRGWHPKEVKCCTMKITNGHMGGMPWGGFKTKSDAKADAILFADTFGLKIDSPHRK